LYQFFELLPLGTSGKTGWALGQLLAHFHSYFGLNDELISNSADAIINLFTGKPLKSQITGTLNGAFNLDAIFHVVNFFLHFFVLKGLS
jgi:hypothetical protein